MHENAERELSQVVRRVRDAEAQVSQLTIQLERASTASSRGDAAAEARALEAERKLQETEQNYEARMGQMEEDYKLAVHYVK
jgi:hypothetical protein